MSDTDDTDVLLLIPPDFFLVHSDSEESNNGFGNLHKGCEPHCGVVGSLISHVYKLESRVNRIENNSDLSRYGSISSNNSTLIPLSEMSDDYRSRAYELASEYLPSSVKSTPQKPRRKILVSSLPNTPTLDRSFQKKQKKQSPPKLLPRRPIGESSKHFQNNNSSTDSNNSANERVDNTKILGEIDKFLNSVKTIQTVRDTSKGKSKNKKPATEEKQQANNLIKFDDPTLTLKDLTEESNKRFSNLNLQDVNNLLNALESQENSVDADDTHINTLYENKNFCTSKESWACGENEESVPDLGYGVRNMMYIQEEAEEPVILKKSTNKNSSKSNYASTNLKTDSESWQDMTSKNSTENTKQPSKTTSSITEKTESSSNSEVSYPTILERPLQVIIRTKAEKLKNDNKSGNTCETCSPVKNIETESSTIFNSQDGNSVSMDLSDMTIQQFSNLQNNSTNFNLFSLADIWCMSGKNDYKISDKEMKKLLPKLEEEKCRRKHCEKLIQELQIKILEMQQRLAVAIQVDSAKDEAILRFHEAWEKVASRWKILESERNTLSKKILCIEQKSNHNLAEANERVMQYEVEMSKAIDLAHSTQEKYKILETERTEMLGQLKQLRQELKLSQENLQILAEERQLFSERIAQLEKESLKDKKLLLDTQNEIARSKTSFLNCQTELSHLKEDYIKLQKKIKEEQGLIKQLESQKNNLNASLKTLEKNEELLKEEIKSLHEKSDISKVELRNFYQQQVEVLVKEKLKEFQDQLENAEKSLQNELQMKEQAIIKQAAKQLHKLTEKHKLEINLIEEKNKEEIRLYELQFTQMKQQINILQSKLDHYHTRQSNIAQELHSVMETQWLQALRILNNNHTPYSSPRPLQQTNRPAGQGDTGVSDLEELKRILATKESLINQENQLQSESGTKIDDLEVSNDNPVKSVSSGQVFQTPVSSKTDICPENGPQGETELHKYIKKLLANIPLHPFEKPSEEEKKKLETSHDSSTSELRETTSNRQQAPSQITRTERSSTARENRSEKPPWK